MWFLVFSALAGSLAAQVYRTYEEELQSETAVIVVTGMRPDEQGEHRGSGDFSVAEGATVRVVDESGRITEKKTQAFHLTNRGGRILYSADFPVKIGSSYKISISFSDGSVIRIDDYKLDASWKRHHYFHSTDGNKSPASLLRKQMDEKTGLWCYVYSLFPLKNYKAVGGTQVE